MERELIERTVRSVVSDALRMADRLHHEDRVELLERIVEELTQHAANQRETNERCGVPDRASWLPEPVNAGQEFQITSAYVIGSVSYDDEACPANVRFRLEPDGSLAGRAPKTGTITSFEAGGRVARGVIQVSAYDYLVLAPPRTPFA